MSATASLKASGLNISPNQLNLPDGSLTTASNVIIKRDNVIEPRRGYALYGNSFGSSSDTCDQLIGYQNRILRHYSNVLQYDDGSGNFTSFSGSYTPPADTNKIGSVVANNNLYFNTYNGVEKISVANTSQLSPAAGFITPAGGIKALDVETSLDVVVGSSSGFLPEDSAVAYRVVWATTDANNNLILGVPSQRSVIYNSLSQLLIADFNRLLSALDQVAYAGGSLLTYANNLATLGLPLTANAIQLYENILTLTDNLDTEILYADNVSVAPLQIEAAKIENGVCTVTFSSGNPSLYISVGDSIYLAGFTPTTGTLNGAQTVTVVTSTTLQFNTTATNITTFADNSGVAPLQISNVTLTGSVATINFSSGTPSAYISPGDLITLAGFTTAIGSINGQQSVITVGSNYITFNSSANNQTLADQTGGAPLQISSAAIASGVLTVTFSSGDPLNALTPAQVVTLSGFSPATGTLNGNQIITTVTANTITINTAATGTVTLTTPTIVSTVGLNSPTITGYGPVALSSPTINSNTYRNIMVPVEPTIPTPNSSLVALQTWLAAIILALQNELPAVIPSGSQTDFLLPLQLTTTANVNIEFTVPDQVTTNYFFQIYRSLNFTATQSTVLADLVPDDELGLVYEAYPTQDEINAGIIDVTDITPDTLRGANLYTNPVSGDGILQSNELPPWCIDINRFKNVVFFANTRTRHRLSFSLLGISKMVTDYNNGDTPTLGIYDAETSNTYSFVLGVNQQITVNTTNGSTLNTSGNATYFSFYSAENESLYYVWYSVGTATDPMINGGVGVKVIALSGDTATEIASKTADALSQYIFDFTISSSANHIVILNANIGYTNLPDMGNSSFTYTIIPGVGQRITQESDTFTCLPGAGLAGLYFTLNTPFNRNQYYIWYLVNGAGVDPMVTNRTGVPVNVLSGDTAANVATKTAAALNSLPDMFIASSNGSTLTVMNYAYGPATPPTVGTSGFTLVNNVPGALDVAMVNVASPAESVDGTARNLVIAINRNRNESVYAYYVSDLGSIPGQIALESRFLSVDPFYLVANNTDTGSSFSPNLSPSDTITSITVGTTSTMTVVTANPHGLANLDQVLITDTNSVPSIDGLYTINYINPTTFNIDVAVTTAGTSGAILPVVDANVSQNEVKPNRVYYSKLQQPEAVPLVNYFDVGTEDRAILRIFPLRNSLFVFKEDGLFRVSGETAPFVTQLFDTSCILIAANTVSVTNNLIFCWTRTGISAVSEAGVTPFISRPIDTAILELASANYPNFVNATWGIGYESDNSYLMATVQQPTDTVPTIIYRYSTLTNSWTTYDKTSTCGLVFLIDDKLYLGAGDVNYIEQERKTFSRLDYADRQYDNTIANNNYYGTTIKLANIDNISAGDAFVQDQTLTVYIYNSLLEKLDIDPGLGYKDYSNLAIAGGANLRTAIVALANMLDSDPNIVTHTFASSIASLSDTITNISAKNPTVITSVAHGLVNGRIISISGSNSLPVIDGDWEVTVIDANTFSIPISVTSPGTTGTFITLDNDFDDIEACYNNIISLLNIDSAVAFNNYQLITGITEFEAIILNVDPVSFDLTLNLNLDFVVGAFTTFHAIDSVVIYTPNTMGDPLSFKHIRESTIIFSDLQFTNAVLSFSTDLLPQFIDIPFNGAGNGIFGSGNGAFGQGFFGGASSAAPFRTYIPQQCQRCRFIIPKFEHVVAREKFSIFGLTMVGDAFSTRAYR